MKTIIRGGGGGAQSFIIGPTVMNTHTSFESKNRNRYNTAVKRQHKPLDGVAACVCS
jgi:hypothetical protein